MFEILMLSIFHFFIIIKIVCKTAQEISVPSGGKTLTKSRLSIHAQSKTLSKSKPNVPLGVWHNPCGSRMRTTLLFS
jgi:hypothetical protein